jgi:hypothetical protein
MFMCIISQQLEMCLSRDSLRLYLEAETAHIYTVEDNNTWSYVPASPYTFLTQR